MVDTSIPRNAQGLTREEWLEQQRNLQHSATSDLTKGDAIINLDIATGKAGFKFSDLGLVIGHMAMTTTPEITEHTNDIPGLYGINYQGMSYGARIFSIPVTLKADNREDYNLKVQHIADALITVDTDSELSIVFGHQPNVQYNGHFSKVPNFDFLSDTSFVAQAVLEFTASDPRGFLIVDGEASPNDIIEVTDSNFEFTPLGSGPADPIIHITPTDQANALTRISYTIGSDPRSGVAVGMSANTAKAFDTKPVVFSDLMEDSTRWLATTRTDISNPNNLVSDGTFKTSVTGAAQTVSTWSSNTSQYQTVGTAYGPMAISKDSFGTLIGNNNWETAITLYHQQKGYSRAASGVYAFMLDNTGKRRAFVGIRDRADGGAPFALVRFGKNLDDEAKALASGLGTQFISGKNVINSTNRKVSLNTTTVNKAYESDKVLDHRDFYWYGNSYRHKWYTKTSITNYDTTTKKYKTVTTQTPTGSSTSSNKNSSGGTVVYRKLAGAHGTNTSSSGNPVVGTIQYWKPGEYKRSGDLINGAIDRKKKYTKRTAKRVNVQNKTVRVVTETNNQSNGKTITTTTTYTYVNGSNPMNGNKWGVLTEIKRTNSTSTNSTNHSTKSVYADKTVGVVDLAETSSLDDALVKFIVGHDTNGFYYQIVQLDPTTGRQQYELLAKTYDKKPEIHSAYNFTPDKIAIHMFATVLPEDIINPETSKPTKTYTKNYTNVTDIKVTKLLPEIDGADLITLKSGQTMTIDSVQQKVFIDGVESNKIDWTVSTFPQLQGGISNTIKFNYSPEYINAKIEYRPTNK
ncbi:phage tail domain-containing protein [Weissella soli]|uniref:phage tail domain-containing protein n=1 Tax=Weissella soli TaxID=155866 RepID=UPI001646C57B|nr:phage tail domain-containing protein [Weissella soli]